MRSVLQQCREFAEVVVIVPRFSAGRVRRALPPGVRLVICPDYPDDYLGQQVSKLYADLVTDTDLLCHLDSDMVFDQPTTPADLHTGGKIRIGHLPLDPRGRHQPWAGPTAEFLGTPVLHDFMCHPPFCYPRWLYRELRQHCEATHGMTLEQYVLTRPARGFSEFTALGAYAYARHRDSFSWCTDPARARCQWHWSRGGLDESTRRALERLTRTPPVIRPLLSAAWRPGPARP